MKFFKEVFNKNNKAAIIVANIIIAAAIVLICSLVLHNENVKREKLLEEAKHYSDVVEDQAKDENDKKGNYSFYQKLKKGYDVDILVIGDSIGKGVGTKEESAKWFNILKKDLEKRYSVKVEITNISMPGTTSYAGYVNTMLLDYEKVESKKSYRQYDLAIICYGQNDADYGFSTNYESIIRAVMKKYPNASIISILESSIEDKSTKIDVIRELCEYYDLQIADTVKAFEKEENLSGDGVHPNEAGQLVYSDTISKIIESNVVANTGKPKNKTALNKKAERYNNFKWYGLDNKKVRQTGSKSYSADISSSGVLGIYASYLNTDNINIYIDGELLNLRNQNLNSNLAHDNIAIIEPNCLINRDIRIDFKSNEEADSFKGFCISQN